MIRDSKKPLHIPVEHRYITLTEPTTRVGAHMLGDLARQRRVQETVCDMRVITYSRPPPPHIHLPKP